VTPDRAAMRVTTPGTWAKFRHGRRHHYVTAHIRTIDTVVMACGYQTWADNAVTITPPGGPPPRRSVPRLPARTAGHLMTATLRRPRVAVIVLAAALAFIAADGVRCGDDHYGGGRTAHPASMRP